MPAVTELPLPRLELVDPQDASRLPEGYLVRALQYKNALDWPNLSAVGTIFMWLIRANPEVAPTKVCFALDRAGHPVYVGNEFGYRPRLLYAESRVEVDIE